MQFPGTTEVTPCDTQVQLLPSSRSTSITAISIRILSELKYISDFRVTQQRVPNVCRGYRQI